MKLHVDETAEQAIEWMSLLRSGAASAEQRAGFVRWRDADPAHQAAWLRLEGALHNTFDAVADPRYRPTRLARQLLRNPPRRRLLRGALALVGVGIGGACLLDRQMPMAAWSADLRSGTGERRRIRLADGSHLLLNTRSAVNVQFDAQYRQLFLREGELIVSVAPDAARPFVVRTRHGSVRALGTRFLVRLDETRTRVFVLHSRVELRTAAGATQQLDAGQGARFDAAAIEGGTVQAAESAWEQGFIEAHDLSLGTVIAELRRYSGRFIRVAPEAAVLRVSGLYPIDDARHALAVIAQTLPVQVENGLFWSRIERR